MIHKIAIAIFAAVLYFLVSMLHIIFNADNYFVLQKKCKPVSENLFSFHGFNSLNSWQSNDEFVPLSEILSAYIVYYLHLYVLPTIVLLFVAYNANEYFLYKRELLEHKTVVKPITRPKRKCKKT
jgi:hypothetical protein